jgi:hypothetical protein
MKNYEHVMTMGSCGELIEDEESPQILVGKAVPASITKSDVSIKKQSCREWITASRLKLDRNWTDGAIKKYLSKSSSQKGYALNDVIKSESDPEFKKWLIKRIHSQIHKKRMRKN